MNKYRIGDIVEGEVIDLGINGEGIVKIDDYPIFVPFVLKGELIKIRMSYVKKDFAFGDLIDILSPSIDRVKPRCPYYTKCGGCDIQHLNKDTQLQLKQKNLANTLRKIAGIQIEIPSLVSLNEWEYRNKLSLPFGLTNAGTRVVLGFYEKKSHAVVPMKWCPLHADWASKLIACVSAWANEFDVTVYNEFTGKGLLRHLVARMLDTLTITVVINGNSLPQLDSLVKNLEEEFKDFTIYISQNRTSTNVIFGDSVKLVYGEAKPQNLGKYSVPLSPLSFLQVNNNIRDAIYNDVCLYLKDFSGDIIELYSGVGLLSAEIALRLPASKITAVEIEADATESATALMKMLEIDNRVENVCSDASEYITQLKANDDISAKALILDPPRKGCNADILNTVLDSSIEQIIYISCNPATLSRDIKILSKSYEIKHIQPYDMFPQTHHLETLVCLRRV